VHDQLQAQELPAWEDAERAAHLAARVPAETGLAAEELLQLCAQSADPDGALAGAVRALAARKERYGKPARRETLPALVRICAASKFLAQILSARPRLLDLLACARFPRRPSRLRAERVPDAGTLARRLRRHKQVEVLRIALRDLSGASLEEVTADLSSLAADAFEAAVRFHYARLCAQHGAPQGRGASGPSGFCVLGMGKLGGEELNFSSDADVLYLYDADGHTAGGLPHFSFYARLAEAVTAAVGSAQATPEGGFVFRVDLELRPEGRSGPIVNSVRGLEQYYEAQGAAWERFALLKARPIAGDLAVGDAALRQLSPFVFRKYFDLKAIDEMRRLKARAEKDAASAGRAPGIDLKLGKGGIREIEFFVQALQLLHGGRDPNLRVRGTLKALERLLFAGLIVSRDRDELSEAYVVLRRLEHRVQMLQERQTHSVPDDPAERRRLARRAGYADAAAMERDLEKHRARVESRFKDLLRVARGGAPGEDPRASAAADPEASFEERAAALAELGFTQPEASAEELERLARKRGTPFHDARPLGPSLVLELAAAPDPDQALRHLADLFGSLANPRATSDMLADAPRTARLLVSLFGSSDFLSRGLLRHPELIDQLVHRGSAPLVRERPDLATDLENRLRAIAPDDTEGALGEIRRFRNEEVLRVGLHDVAGALEVAQVARQLSDLADVCVESCFALARAEIEKRHGARDASLSVIALGKLGGRELGYHSDLDLLFLYSTPGEHGANHEYFARLAQKLIGHLTLQLREGILYRIDTRLRPSGSAGPLVISFEALQSYHAREARLWERQALLKARPVAGDEALFARAHAQVLEPSILRPIDRQQAAREMLAMRERMEREIAAESPGRYNSKLGRGGLVDVEFAVQFLQLVHGAAHRSVCAANTPQALSALREAGLLSDDDHAPLASGYRFLRKLESRLRIVRDRSVDRLPEEGPELLRLARRMGYSGGRAGEALLADYQRATSEVRAAFLRVLS